MEVVDIQVNNKKVKKAYLAQSKLGYVTGKDKKGFHIFKCKSSSDILQQAEKMLAITSDSFFFIYTEEGIFTIPAFQIRLCNKKKDIDSNEIYFHGLGSFYTDFFKCFIGDEKIGESFELIKDIKLLSENKKILNQLEINNLSYVSIKQTEKSVQGKK